MSHEFKGGTECKRCGKPKRIPPPELVADWLDAALVRCFDGQYMGGVDPDGSDRGSALVVFASLHVRMTSYAARLRGICDPCFTKEAEERGEADEFFHEFVSTLWQKQFQVATRGDDAERKLLACAMADDCRKPVTHIDNRGFTYCTPHGQQRKPDCRKLGGREISLLAGGYVIDFEPKAEAS